MKLGAFPQVPGNEEAGSGMIPEPALGLVGCA
jgi:hypothetical protein